MKFALALQRVPSVALSAGRVLYLIPAAEKDLRRSQTSGAEDDALCGLFAGNHPPMLEAIEHDTISAVPWLDISHQMQGAHLGAALLGSRNVVDVQAVLGPHVTADVAVAQMDARPLFLPVRVDELMGVLVIEWVLELVVPILRKTDGQRGFRESIGMAKVPRGLARELEAVGQLAVRHDLQVHFASDRVVEGLQLRVRNLRGPPVREDLWIGFHGHAAIAQGSAANTGGLRHGHAVEKPHVHPAIVTGRLAGVEDPGIAWFPGILIGLPPAAALQHEHTHTFFRQPARRNRSSKAAADDDDVEACAHGGGSVVIFVLSARVARPIESRSKDCSGSRASRDGGTG